jgi:hypothetical protein
MTRTLVLRKESLTELTPGELGAVVGGSQVSRTCALVSFVPCYVLMTVVDGCLP